MAYSWLPWMNSLEEQPAVNSKFTLDIMAFNYKNSYFIIMKTEAELKTAELIPFKVILSF